MKRLILITTLTPLIAAAAPINYPHSQNHSAKTMYSSFSEAPKTLDPARAYSANELSIIAQIVEPAIQYHYFKRPFELTILTASSMPTVKYFDKKHHQLPNNTEPENIAYSSYTIKLKDNILYAPHPAFAKDKNGKYRYLQMTQDFVDQHPNLKSFPYTGTRALTANDYAYEIKRLADPKLHSPIYSMMQKYILGLATLHNKLSKLETNNKFINLNNYNLSGVHVSDENTYTITIKGFYPQFKYWLAMPFFRPHTLGS